jgi:glucose-6-phosphate isomerase
VGGLFWGTTWIEPGLVGDEYHCTKGHFHATGDRAEIYFCFQGQGRLVYMDRDRRCWMEPMSPGSVHYIPAQVAHRTVNVGEEVLSFGACWPSDAGHDYAAIARDGFSARVRRINGTPILAPVN